MTIKTLKNMKEIQLYYDLLTINIIFSGFAGWIKKLTGPHMGPGL